MSLNPFKEALDKRAASREKWRGINTQTLVTNGIPYTPTKGGDCLEIREHEGLSVDFFVCDRKWVHEDTGKRYRGSATVFLDWYNRMKDKGYGGSNG